MDTKSVNIIGNIVKFGIAIIGLFFALTLLFKGVDNGNDKYIDYAINLSIWVIVIAFVIAILFALFYFITNIKNSIGALIGIAGLLIIFAISYSMADGSLMDGWAKIGITEKISKLTGTGIYSFLILIGVAALAAVSTEIIKIVK